MTTIHNIQDLFRLLAAHPEYREEIRRYVLTEELLNLPARFDQFGERFDRFEEHFNRFVDEQRRINRETRRDIGELRQDVSQLKGAHARNETTGRAPIIAMRMGLTYIRTLEVRDLVFMVRDADTSGIEPPELESFVDADLVIESTDESGQTAYIAMEVSYTANRQDTGRAIRNAEFLSRFTGQPAQPAVVSVRNDPEIGGFIASGEVGSSLA